MTTTRFAVPDISCEGCKTAIEGALRPIAGVESVDVDVSGRVVDVVHEPLVDAGRLVAAVEDQGYTVAARQELS
jgi:copper chaperone